MDSILNGKEARPYETRPRHSADSDYPPPRRTGNSTAPGGRATNGPYPTH